MQRLYSRFPGGGVGVGLLLLRLIVASGFIGAAVLLLDMDSVALGIGFVLVLSGALISVGARTSTAAVVGCLGAVVALIHNSSMPGVSETKPDMWIWLSVLAVLACSLALLGPGGYSLDARLFGWKTVHLSSHRRIEVGTNLDISQSREAHENDGNS